MQIALRQLLLDFLSAAFFYVVIALGGSITLALALGVGLGLIQIAIQRSRGQTIPRIQLMGLVVVLGGSSILLNDPRLIMLKPTISRSAFGVIMLQPGWVRRYLPPSTRRALSPEAIDRTGYVWAALMFALAIVNLVVTATCSVQTWAAYASVGPTVAKVVAIALTYVTLRALVNRRLGPAPTS